MGVEKGEIKKGTLEEVGIKLDDMLESAQRQHYAHIGAKQALTQCAKQISTLAKQVDGEIDAGEYDLQVATHVKKYIGRAQMAAEGAGRQQGNQELVSSGKIEALQAAVKAIQKQHALEDAKIQALREAEQAALSDVPLTQSERRVAGQHPGPSLAQQRKAETAEAVASTDGSGTIEVIEAMNMEKPKKKKGAKKNGKKKSGTANT